MSIEHDSTLTGPIEIDDNLIEAFKKLELLVRDQAGSLSPSDDSLAVLRLLRNIDVDTWERLSRENDLPDWLYFPLRKDAAESVRQLLAIQKRLIHGNDHDPLTGIYNRRFLNRNLEIEVERAARSQSELSLLYLDIDNFKQVNDSFGHDCGDKVLIQLAQLLHNSVRHYDLAVRLGGDEFVVLLPTSSCWTGVMMGNRLLESFSNIVFDCEGNTFTLSFSAGVSSLALCSEDSAKELLKSADTAMYEAKRAGKNNVILAQAKRKAKDHASLVQAQEKLFLFLGSDPE